MSRYRIADFEVKMECQSDFFKQLSVDYHSNERTMSEEKNIVDISYTEEELDKAKKEEDFSLEMFEYNTTLLNFFQKIIPLKAFCFHASALMIDGEAILFSADSGTGKSTHAKLWKKYLSANHEVIRLNDDKPVIRLKEENIWVYGSPWSGKHCINANKKAPLKALVFLKQAKENKIYKVPMEEAFSLVFPQTFLDRTNPMQRMQILELLDQFIRRVPVYQLACNISEEAVQLVYRTIWEE